MIRPLRPLWPALVLAVAACSSPPATPEPVQIPYPAGVWPATPATPVPTATPMVFPQPCGVLYDPAVLETFELEMDPATWQTMKDEYAQKIENWHGPVTFRWNGEEKTDVMIRNRGNNSRCGDKIQIAIAFNQVDSHGRFHGVRRIDLDHGGWGCRTVEERVVLDWMRDDVGLPTQCVNHARLVVNGEYYGLFTNLEHQDHEFLERNFPDPDGNLYKDGWEKKTHESDPDRSDLNAFWNADSPEGFQAVADVDEAMQEWAAEAVVPSLDNYWLHGWNYYLYDDPSRHFLFLPNDMDDAYPAPDAVKLAPLPVRVAPADWLLGDETLRGQFLEKLDGMTEALDPDRLSEHIDEVWAQVREAAHEDPNLRWNPDTDRYAGLKSRFHQRQDFLRSWSTCVQHPTSGMDADGDGFRWCQECNDGNASIHPGATEVCGNGVDDDCDGAVDEGCVTPTPTPTSTPTPTATPAPTATP